MADVRHYGAKGDGIADDTAAFAAALATNQTVWVPPGRYLVHDVAVPSGAKLYGDAGRAYSGDTFQKVQTSPVLIAAPGASSILNVSGTRKVTLSGMVLDGVSGRAERESAAPNCISGGSTQLYVQNVTALRCHNGLGGAEAPSRDGYTHNLILLDSQFADCSTGISDLVDGLVEGGAVSANYDGISLGDGSAADDFIGVRVEWNHHDGYTSYKASHIQLIGGMIDRNFATGIEIKASHYWLLSGLDLRRNNRDETDPAADIVIDSSSHVLLGNSVSRQGRDDGPTGALTPRYVVYFEGDRNQFVTITGNDLTGFVPGGAPWGGTPPQDFILRDNAGALDVASGEAAPSTGEAGLRSAGPLGRGERAVLVLAGAPLPPNGDATRILTIRAHDLEHGKILEASFPIALHREAGPAGAETGTAFGRIGGDDAMGFSNRQSTLSLALAVGSEDGSSLKLTVTNGDQTAWSITAELR